MNIIFLILGTGLAVFCQNSSWRIWYDWVLTQPLVRIGTKTHLSFRELINDGFMTLFFFSIGLELQQEFFNPKSKNAHAIILPALGALGGMIAPGILYGLVNFRSFEYIQGWAIPTATDIPFVLAILACFGSNVSNSLKLFITVLAIFDDLGAVLVIAGFYTNTLYWAWLCTALSILILLTLLRHYQIAYLSVYLLLGFLLWMTLFQAGVHTSIAGVLLGFILPQSNFSNKKNIESNPGLQLQCLLKPWIEYILLPIFAWANAGVSLESLRFSNFSHPVFLGTLLGLWVGKPLGILLGVKIAVQMGIAQLPKDWTPSFLISVTALAGIGFTMSLLISTLAFTDQDIVMLARQGIFLAAVLSIVTAAVIIHFKKLPRFKRGIDVT